MTTPIQLINQALKASGVLGVGQTATAEDTNDAFFQLNMMISQWNRKRWLVYHLQDVALTSTGAQYYTVGIGGNFNTPRPDKLEAAYFRQLLNSQPNQVDYPLVIIDSYEDYSRISLKQLTTFSQYIFYDSGYPLGKVYPWPIPQANLYEIHLIIKVQLDRFTDIAEEIVLPPEYEAALMWNLAVRLRPMYQLDPDVQILALAKDALNVIRTANTQISELSMPRGLARRNSVYNIYSDNY